MKVLRSDCCEQPVTMHSQDKGWRGVTNWYICIKCQEPCNAIEIEVDCYSDKSKD